MDRREFQAWLSAAETLTKAQKAEAVEVLAGRPAGTASLAAIEFGVGEERHCPHCGTAGAVARGYARGLRRPAGGQCRGSPGGFRADHRKGRPAGLRRLHQLPALRRRPRHQP